MAEAVGLSLAILGLAGNLKGCLDMFAYFSSARDFGRDYSVLASKFDIEKALVLKWAERVRILHPDYDPRLNDNTTLELVSGILANIKRLLDDGAVLQRKYGLKRVDSTTDIPQGLLGDGSALGPPEEGISDSMMQRFTKDFQSLCIRAKKSQSTTSTKQKFLWVIGQKDKFEKLVNDLAHFVSKLDQIVPDRGDLSLIREFGDGLTQKIFQLMTESSRRAFHTASAPEDRTGYPSPQVAELAQLRMARDAAREDQALGNVLSDVADRILIQKSESMVIEAIWFRSLQARRESIEPAHLKTLAWVLESTRDTGDWDNLANCLKSDSGVYWVSGKAGSGKSTLMKYVHNHTTTLELLEQWASGDSLLVASFFFWGLGSNEQKSLHGLSRSLLYHIIERYPFLVPKLFPAIWREVYVTNERNLHVQDLAPTDTDLKGAFNVLPTIIAEHGIKICLFIDGLDEYEGNLREAIQMIVRLGQAPNIKVVVSSRPEPACVSAFSTLKKLRLQDLNRPDIQEYVDSTVGAHPYMQVLRKDDDAGCARLLEDLADRASGVFPWIILACRSLLDGFESTDRLCELRERLEELPRELAEMFQHMLNRVPLQYHKQTAKLLKLAERCQVAPWHRDDPHHYGMPALTLFIMERGKFHPESVRFDNMSISEKYHACEEIEGRVRSRTGGLLELVSFGSLLVGPQFCQHHDIRTLPIGHREPAKRKINSMVRFMHRTVFDFLHDPTVRETLNALQLATKGGFDAESVLAAMSIARVHFTSELGMTEFLERNLHNPGQSAVQQGHNGRPPLLYYTLIQPSVTQDPIEIPPGTSVPPSSRTASYLLDQGFHPMQQVSTNFSGYKTIWEAWLERLAERADIRTLKESWEITMKMIDYGAEPRIMREHKSNVASSLFDLLFQYEEDYTGEEDSDECHRLRELLDEWRSGSLSNTSEGEEPMSGSEIEEGEDQVVPKRPRSEDYSDGPDSKRRRYDDDDDEDDYSNRENVDDYFDDDDAGEGDGFEDNFDLYLQL